jgi:hypothetical protein
MSMRRLERRFDELADAVGHERCCVAGDPLVHSRSDALNPSSGCQARLLVRKRRRETEAAGRRVDVWPLKAWMTSVGVRPSSVAHALISRGDERTSPMA